MSKVNFACSFGFNKLNCIVLSFNQTVIKLHQKFGFVIEGAIKDYIYRNNLFLDLILLGIKKEQWLECKKKIETIFKIN
jgi:RimJ/RimL family protein N-acetyltransferase